MNGIGGKLWNRAPGGAGGNQKCPRCNLAAGDRRPIPIPAGPKVQLAEFRYIAQDQPLKKPRGPELKGMFWPMMLPIAPTRVPDGTVDQSRCGGAAEPV